MKIKLISDLHLEGRYGYWMKPQAWLNTENVDVLVLAGDIHVGIHNVSIFIKHCLDLGFKRIVYIPGNHELYREEDDIAEFTKRFVNNFKEYPNVHNLSTGPVKIDDVTFFGDTLWTCFDYNPMAELAAMQGINDFRVIKGFTIKKCIEMYETQSAFIKYNYENIPGKKVIVTHFLPAKQCVHPKWGGSVSLLNSYFANDLGEWIESISDTTWLFGHTHDCRDIMIGETRLISNPMGYGRYDSDENFNPHLLIEV